MSARLAVGIVPLAHAQKFADALCNFVPEHEVTLSFDTSRGAVTLWVSPAFDEAQAQAWDRIWWDLRRPI